MEKHDCIYFNEKINKCKACNYRFTMTIKWKIGEIIEEKKREPGEMGWPDTDKHKYYHLYCDLSHYLSLANKKIVKRSGDTIHINDLALTRQD